MSRGKKILIGIGVLVVLAIMTAVALRGGRDGAVEVRTEAVSRRDLVAKVSATGYIEPKRLVDISADVSGRVVELNVEEGDEVTEGDLLLVIDPARFEAAVQRAEAALAEASARESQARGGYLQAQRDWERIRDLKARLPSPRRNSRRHARTPRSRKLSWNPGSTPWKWRGQASGRPMTTWRRP
jgi:HlyD family secretion protein